MKLRTEKITESVKITKNGDTATFQITPLTPADDAKLAKKHTPKKKWIGNTMEEKEINFVELQIDRIVNTIKDWDIQDEKGKKIECTAANKELVYLLNPEIINEVMDKARDLSRGLLEDEEINAKN